MKDNTVYIVHGIDTEGPLYESIYATFERLERLYNIKDIKPTRENLKKIQNGQFDFGEDSEKIAASFNPHLMNYLSTWDQVDDMLDRVTTKEFRSKLLDSFGGEWVYNWHCVDHIGYDVNPRKRDIGYHNIFDHYQEYLANNYRGDDQIHFHFHPMSTYRDASINATSYINSPELYQIIARRIIEREWFPTVNRAGFHVERPDSHWFLEQWIPFDISNLSKDEKDLTHVAKDWTGGKLGDWRRATQDWAIYQPSHDDYQVEGTCRRYIARILNVLGRLASIDEEEVEKAFLQASSGKPAIIGVTGHDFRDLGTEVDHVRDLIAKVSKKYPDVKFKYSEVKDAFRKVLWPEKKNYNDLDLSITYHDDVEIPYIEIRTLSGEVFGPQPFLAIQTKSNRFIHDNFDFSMDKKSWTYSFYEYTLPIDDIKRIGVGANDKYGNMFAKSYSLEELKDR